MPDNAADVAGPVPLAALVCGMEVACNEGEDTSVKKPAKTSTPELPLSPREAPEGTASPVEVVLAIRSAFT
jgi:hypothetical protein